MLSRRSASSLLRWLVFATVLIATTSAAAEPDTFTPDPTRGRWLPFHNDRVDPHKVLSPSDRPRALGILAVITERFRKVPVLNPPIGFEVRPHRSVQPTTGIAVCTGNVAHYDVLIRLFRPMVQVAGEGQAAAMSTADRTSPAWVGSFSQSPSLLVPVGDLGAQAIVALDPSFYRGKNSVTEPRDLRADTLWHPVFLSRAGRRIRPVRLVRARPDAWESVSAAEVHAIHFPRGQRCSPIQQGVIGVSQWVAITMPCMTIGREWPPLAVGCLRRAPRED